MFCEVDLLGTRMWCQFRDTKIWNAWKNKRSDEMNHNCVGSCLKLKIVTNVVWQLWLLPVYGAHPPIFFPHRSTRIEVQPCIRPMIEVRHICRFDTFTNIEIKLVKRMCETRWNVNMHACSKFIAWRFRRKMLVSMFIV